MRLFVLPRDFNGQKFFKIEGKDAHYLSSVLRLPIGQSITARDRGAGLWSLKLLEIKKNCCTVEATKLNEVVESTDSLPQCQDLKEITLYQCITKAKKLEQIVRQATEIGVRNIVLVNSHFSQNEKYRDERLEAQIKEAIEQSGSMVATSIIGPISINDVPSHWNNKGSALFFHQTGLDNQKHLGQILKDLSAPVAVLIGSEGGLDDSECNLLRDGGFEPVLLDTNILRAETASVYALGIVQTAIQCN